MRKKPLDIHAILASRRQIAVIWDTDDVHTVRPDLTDAQAWEVLKLARSEHDSETGINWGMLEYHANDLFGEAPDTDEADDSDTPA